MPSVKTLIASFLFLFASVAHAQVTPAQNGIVQSPYGGIVYSTSTSGTAKLFMLQGTSAGQVIGWNGTAWVATTSSSSGGSGTISTSSALVAGQSVFATGPSTIASVATGTLAENVTGLQFDASRYLIGGSATLSLTSGYEIFLSASGTNWNSFYDIPSTRIGDGTGLTWSGNTLNCDTATASVQGCLTGTDWSIFNNKISSTSLSGASVISYTSGTGVITTTGGTFGAGNYVFPTNLTVTGNATTTNLFSTTASSTNLFTSNGTSTTFAIRGLLFDSLGSPGASGTVLLSTGVATKWVATTSLNVAAITSLNGLTASTQTFATTSANGGWGFSSSGSTHTLNIPTANATNPLGLLSNTDWSTFNNKISSTSLSASYPISYNSTTGAFSWLGLGTTTTWTGGQVAYVVNGNTIASVATGTVSTGSSQITVTAGRSVLGGALSIDCATATAGQSGCLSSTDWSVFNNKISSTSIDTSAELAALVTDETGTAGSLVFSISPAFTGTYTFVNASGSNATTTNATSTNLVVSNSVTFNGMLTGCLQSTSGVISSTGSSCGGGGGSGDSVFSRSTGPQLIYTPTTTDSVAFGGTTAPSAKFLFVATTSTFTISSTTANTGSIWMGTTTSNANFALHALANNTNTNLFQIASSTANSTSTLFTIKNSGFVGIGTFSPQSLLTVARQETIQVPVSGSSAQFVGLDGNPLRMTFDTHNNANTSGTAFMFRRSRGTAATPLALTTDDVLGSINFRGYGATGYAAGSTGLINARAEGTFTDTSMPTALTFDTTATDSVLAGERMRITGMGFVGIGTTTPQGLLSIASSTWATTTQPLFSIGTTSPLLNVFVSTSTAKTSFGAITSPLRLSIGNSYDGAGNFQNQLFYNQNIFGTWKQEGWMTVDCPLLSIVTATADAYGIGCTGLMFQIDSVGTYNGLLTLTDGGQYSRAIVGVAAGTGAGVFFTKNYLRAATNTPIIRGSIRLATQSVAASGATSTVEYFGFTSTDPTGSTFETEPTSGCFLTASSTATSVATQNWKFVVRSTLSGTVYDTGIPTTTTSGASGAFRNFQIALDSEKCVLSAQTGWNSPFQTVITATKASDMPTTTALSAGLYSTKTITDSNAVTPGGIDFQDIWFSSRTYPMPK